MLKNSNNTLIEFDGNRKNNFTAIRFMLAWLVLYGHSFYICKTTYKDPLKLLFKESIWIGALAVYGFFAISGFLVTASFINRGVKNYLISRTLRVLPALFICTLVTVFIIGPLLTELKINEYLSDFEIYEYLLRNSIGIVKMKFTLPGVFISNKAQTVNGPLWTLAAEMRCYLLLALLGCSGLLENRIVANIFIFTILLLGLNYYQIFPLIGSNLKWAPLALYFLIGIFFYVNRDKVFLNKYIAFFALLLIIVSFGKKWFDYTFPLSFVYLLFYLAYKTRHIDVDNTIGDISYGLYIYAWPIQQITAANISDTNPYINIIFSTAFSVPIAYLSWHFIEKPVLSYFKTRMVGM